MSAPYRISLDIGPYSWVIERGDPPALPVLLDGLTVSWQFPDSNLWPVQPEPVTASFSILAEAAADLAEIDEGTPVLLRVWAGVTLGGVDYDSITFTGTVTDLAGEAATFNHPDTEAEVKGWRLDITAVDTLAALGEYTPTGEEWNIFASAADWVTYLFALAGLPAPANGPTTGDSGGSGWLPTDPAGGTVIEGTALNAAADAYLTAAAEAGDRDPDPSSPYNYEFYGSHGWRRGILRPNTDPAGVVDPDHPYRFEWVSRRYGEAPGIGPAAPGKFANLGTGLYGPIIDPQTTGLVDLGTGPIPVYDASIVVDAGYLAGDGAQWTRSKAVDPNEVIVSTSLPPERYEAEFMDPWRSVTATNREPGESLIGAALADTRIGFAEEARYVADMYLDDSAQDGVVWSASGFKWLASEDPAWPVNRSLFPGTELFGDWAAPVVITGIPDAQRPITRAWYVGVPKAVTWTFDRTLAPEGDGGFWIGFDLYHRVPRPISSGAIGLTWDDLGTDFPAVTWDDLEPAYQWIDYRVIRSALYY